MKRRDRDRELLSAALDQELDRAARPTALPQALDHVLLGEGLTFQLEQPVALLEQPLAGRSHNVSDAGKALGIGPFEPHAEPRIGNVREESRQGDGHGNQHGSERQQAA